MGKSSNFKPGIFQLWQSWLWKIIWFHCSVEIGDAHLLDCFTKTMCSINGLVHRKTYGKPCCSRLFVDQPNDLRWKKMEKTHWPSHPSPSRFHWICSVECRLNLWRGSAFDTFGPPSSRSWSPLSAPKGSRNKEKIGNSKVHHVIFHSGYIIQKWHRIRIQHDIVYIYMLI